MRSRQFATAALILGVSTTVVTWLANAGIGRPEPPEYRIVRQAVGTGKWQSQRRGPSKRDWSVQAKQMEDGSLGGSVHVAGASMPEVKLEGRVDGSDVYGVLLSEAGTEVGSFEGRLDATGLSGTYRTIDGDSGSWHTDAPAVDDAPVVAMESSAVALP